MSMFSLRIKIDCNFSPGKKAQRVDHEISFKENKQKKKF